MLKWYLTDLRTFNLNYDLTSMPWSLLAGLTVVIL